jgi:hypothetical protein
VTVVLVGGNILPVTYAYTQWRASMRGSFANLPYVLYTLDIIYNFFAERGGFLRHFLEKCRFFGGKGGFATIIAL